MSRLAVTVNLPEPPVSTRNLAYRLTAINNNGPAPSVRCTVCFQWGKVNSKLRTKGTPFICGPCRAAC